MDIDVDLDRALQKGRAVLAEAAASSRGSRGSTSRQTGTRTRARPGVASTTLVQEI